MADRIIAGESRETIALKLMEMVAMHEDKNLARDGGDRDYVLRLYYECLRVATGYEPEKAKA